MTTIHSKSKSTAKSTTSTESTEPPATTAVVSLAPPPATAVIPTPPPGATTVDGTTFVGVAPRSAELAALPIAIQDLQRFAKYGQTLGTLAPDHAQVLNTFDVANQWSAMRVKTSAWDAHCVVQEGIGWRSMRAQMESLRPAFALAVKADPTLTTQYPGLASLLDAKSAIAKKSASTRQANKAAAENGEGAFHGKIGKQRKKAAANAALTAASTSASTSTQAAATTAAPTPAATSGTTSR